MKRKPFVFAAALVVAAGLIGAKVLIAPPVSVAATEEGIDINRIALSTPKDLPSFDAKYQRHFGVLDVLNAP